MVQTVFLILDAILYGLNIFCCLKDDALDYEPIFLLNIIALFDILINDFLITK